jgi:hypothetical protein
MNKGVPWSIDEDRHLRDFAHAGFTVREIALQMNRSRSVIQRHSAMLGIKVASGRNLTAVDRLVGLKANGK